MKIPSLVVAAALALVGPGLPARLASAAGETDSSASAIPEAPWERLRSLPYVNWSPEEDGREESSVVLHDRERAFPGYNLVASRVTPRVILFDMDGTTVHEWRSPHDTTRVLEAAELVAGKDLLVLDKFRWALHLDPESRVLWKTRIAAHHDISLSEEGRLYTWVRQVLSYRGLRVRFPDLVELDFRTGKIERRWSTYEHLDEIKEAFDTRSFLDTLAEQDSFPDTHRYDYFHPNTVEFLGPNPHRSNPVFAPGNLLICFRNIDQIAILDRDTLEILWTWGADELDWPHHPTMLPTGNILVFDNGRTHKRTRVVELDPVTGEIVWSWGERPGEHFFSPLKGSAQRLPNGNTLVADGENGRAFEVTREREIVWEYLNPEKNASGHRATLYRITRYAPGSLDPALLSREPSGR